MSTKSLENCPKITDRSILEDPTLPVTTKKLLDELIADIHSKGKRRNGAITMEDVERADWLYQCAITNRTPDWFAGGELSEIAGRDD